MQQLLRLFRRFDRLLFILWTAAWTLSSARTFYGYMLKQTEGEWSAPLDDVFIHFDYARATALGHPFEWTVGNGYSSGNTSLTYPFVLAAGWLAGFKDRDLMKWAAIVAMVCVFGTILAARKLFIERDSRDDWGHLSSFLLPPMFLGVGALDWSLWSGMEVSFFLATWAIALVAWMRLEKTGSVRDAWLLGLAGALLVTTRPEASLTIGIFGLAAAQRHRRGRPLALLAGVGVLPFAMLVLQAIANRALTGEWSANGAVVKLALNNPYMTGEDKFKDWFGNAQYASLRNLDYHFADIRGEVTGDLVSDSWSGANPLVYLSRTWWWAGVIPLVLALLPLIFGRTRRIAIIVWAQIVAWICIVALNGQVRWQNERYVMPAIAWMLILSALGVSVACRAYTKRAGFTPLRPSIGWSIVLGALVVQTVGVLTRPPGPPHFRLGWIFCLVVGGAVLLLLFWWRTFRIALLGITLVLAYDHQIPKMRDQKFFFGRASRNIRDQHLAIGKYLKELQPNRVLVGDAGAILYESDRPGLDIIGLGGFRGMPFARAGVHGLASTLELLENVPAADRPDVLAIFPTWWGPIVQSFTGEEMRRFAVEGNVICGGYEQNVYKADWHLLTTGQFTRWNVPKGEKVRAEIDVADLLSEKAADYKFDHPNNGWTEMRVLPDPDDKRKDMFDGGRRIAFDRSESFNVRDLVLGKPARLIVRTAQENKTRVRIRVNGQDAGTFELDATGGWADNMVVLDGAHVRDAIRISLTNEGPGDFVDYHVWITQ